MFEPTQRDVDHDVGVFMKMFERAQVGEVAPVVPARFQSALLVLDGSSQDDLSIRFARLLKESFGCRLSVLDARENISANDLAEQVAGSLGGSPLPKSSGDDFTQILEGIGACACGVVVVPCPFGRDLQAVGPDSTGTVIDVLLSRSPVPVLVVRKPYAADGGLYDRVQLVLIGENEAAPAAAAWAAAFASSAPSGHAVQLRLILEEEFYENIRDLMQAVDPHVDVTPESLEQALLQTHVRLHVALEKCAAEHGFRYDLSVRRERELPDQARSTDAPDAQTGETSSGPTAGEHPLLVLALERSDHLSQGHVHDTIRRSAHSLLIVPTTGDQC